MFEGNEPHEHLLLVYDVWKGNNEWEHKSELDWLDLNDIHVVRKFDKRHQVLLAQADNTVEETGLSKYTDHVEEIQLALGYYQTLWLS